MMLQDPTIKEQVIEEVPIIVSSKHCSELFGVLEDFEFLLHHTLITIKPRGYLYSQKGQSDCFIGIRSINDAANQYRLGTIFLRNFYVGFDYDKNRINIGLNKGTKNAEIKGSSKYADEKENEKS